MASMKIVTLFVCLIAACMFCLGNAASGDNVQGNLLDTVKSILSDLGCVLSTSQITTVLNNIVAGPNQSGGNGIDQAVKGLLGECSADMSGDTLNKAVQELGPVLEKVLGSLTNSVTNQ